MYEAISFLSLTTIFEGSGISINSILLSMLEKLLRIIDLLLVKFFEFKSSKS